MGITEIIEKLQDLQYQLDDAIDSGDWDEVKSAKENLEEIIHDADRVEMSFDEYE
jgi:hypothetical protein